jgi:hypothetical protein
VASGKLIVALAVIIFAIILVAILGAAFIFALALLAIGALVIVFVPGAPGYVIGGILLLGGFVFGLAIELSPQLQLAVAHIT